VNTINELPLDLFVDAQPFHLLLAWTSAKNFLLYDTALRQRNIAIEDLWVPNIHAAFGR
jgi:hypothetical protein